MAFDVKSVPGTFYGALTNFHFYRDLSRRPLGHGFIYLLLLVLLPVLLFTAPQIIEMNRLMTRITRALQGNLPPLRIDKGAVIMDAGEFFHFEAANEFPVAGWRSILELLTSRPDRVVQAALARRKAGEGLSGEEEELVREFERRKAAGETGLAWIEEHFPDREALITTEPVDRKMEEAPPEDPEAGKLLRESSHFFNFVFRVDLTTDDPELPPGMMGFALGSRSYTINTPLFPKKISFPETTSAVINDEMLDSWRKSFVWQMAPVLAAMMLVISYLVLLLVILGGSAAAGLTASLLKCALPFRQVFTLALYAITPAIVFLLLYLGILLLGFNISYPFLVFLAVYGFYLVSAVRRCCSPA